MATPTTLPAAFVAGDVLLAEQLNDVRGAFRILQVVSATYSTQITTTSGTYVTSNLTATITPTSDTSQIYIVCTGNFGNTGAGYVRATIFRGTVTGTNLAAGTQFSNTYALHPLPFAMNYLDSPATTSATTYTLGYFSTNPAATAYMHAAPATSVLTLMEVSA